MFLYHLIYDYSTGAALCQHIHFFKNSPDTRPGLSILQLFLYHCIRNHITGTDNHLRRQCRAAFCAGGTTIVCVGVPDGTEPTDALIA